MPEKQTGELHVIMTWQEFEQRFSIQLNEQQKQAVQTFPMVYYCSSRRAGFIGVWSFSSSATKKDVQPVLHMM